MFDLSAIRILAFCLLINLKPVMPLCQFWQMRATAMCGNLVVIVVMVVRVVLA